MENLIYQVILGWPSAVLGLLLLASGVIFRKVALSILGAIAATGFCLFASTYLFPYSLVLLLVIVSNWTSVICMSKGRRGIAAVLIFPLAIENMFFGYAVYAQ